MKQQHVLFQGGVAKSSEQPKKPCGGLSHLRKYDLLNIFKTNIPLRLLISTIITLIAGVCH